jgi:nucleoside-diphosphate-sugar epimerase
MEIKKVLVTGSEGYIGTTLVEKLLRTNYSVVGLDTCYFNNPLKKSPKHEIITTDIRDIEKIHLKGFDAIIHLAALSNDPMGEITPDLTYDINYKATVALAKKAKKSGVKQFIFSSSCSVYGTAANGIVDETSKPNPITHYAISKVQSEDKLKKLANSSFTVNLLRNSTVYGYSPNFRDDLVVNNLTLSAYLLGSLNILSDGTPWRPLIDVRDLSDVFIAFLQNGAKLNGELINIGFQENNVQVKDIVTKIHTLIPKAKINYMNERPDDKRSYQVDFQKFASLFSEIHQQWPLEKSIADLIQMLREANVTKDQFLNGDYTRLTQLKRLIEKNKLNDTLHWQ